MRKFTVLLLAFSLFLSGCGPGAEFARARRLEKKGKTYAAWEKYQELSAAYPQHPRAPEVLFRAGWLSQRELGDCYMAQAFYDDVLERYPQSDPWAKMAAFQRNQCPDYFPLLPEARWVEGDSETKGKNARIETVCKPPEAPSGAKGGNYFPSQAGRLVRTYFAGEKKFRTIEVDYKKADGELLEFSEASDPRGKVILKWPLKVGTRWSTAYGGRTFRYEVVAAGKSVTVAAGRFDGCVQVRSQVDGIPGATNEYYAPGVGRILTTFASAEGEKPNPELLSHRPAALPAQLVEEKKK